MESGLILLFRACYDITFYKIGEVIMSLFKKFICKYIPLFNIIFSIIWLNNLAHTDAYFSVYAVICFFSFYLVISGPNNVLVKENRVLPLILSCLFSVLTVLGNYPLFTLLRDPERIGRATNLMVNMINTGFSLIGGVCVFTPILSWFFNRKASSENTQVIKKYRYLPVTIFLIIAGINLIHLLLVEFPGNITEDTISQIEEMVSGNYSNFNTFWHTMMFETVLSVGYHIFGSVNTAAGLFSVFQILVMAFAFTYCLVTMDEYGVSPKITLVSFLLFLLMPYHMALIISIWKDVLFAGGCLIMITALLRMIKGIGAHFRLDRLLFVVGSLLFILSRTNGWIIYLVLTVLYLLFNRKNRFLLIAMSTMAILGWFLLNPMLSILNVSGGDPVESLSIPIQQVSRVIAEGHGLSEEDLTLLSRVVDIEEVPELYVEWLSDPMKVEVRSKDYDYFLSNFSQYRDLWIRLGIKYPWTYVKAWVEQTKGYWNGGYGYAMYSETVIENPYGIVKTGGGNPVASLFRLYFGLSRHVVFFEPFHSIGLHVWLMILCFILNLIKKNDAWIISVPLLLLVIGLWFGTPVYACFRYVYPLFVCVPLIVSTALSPRE